MIKDLQGVLTYKNTNADLNKYEQQENNLHESIVKELIDIFILVFRLNHIHSLFS